MDEIRIRVEHIDRLTRNMHLDIITTSNEYKSGYFKRFVAKDAQGKNVYRSSLYELKYIVPGVRDTDISVFFTDSEYDPPKYANGQQAFVKSDSVIIKNISEIYLIPPAALVPFIQKQYYEIKQLKLAIRAIEKMVNKLQPEKSHRSKQSN